MSLFVAVTIVPVLCAKLLRPPSGQGRRGLTGVLFRTSERALDAAYTSYRGLLVFVPTMYTLFEEGLPGLKRGLRKEVPAAS